MANYGQRKFVLNHSRLKRSLRQGFKLREDGSLLATEDTVHRFCILGRLDSNLPDCKWGRLAMRLELAGDMILTIRAFASNQPEFIQSGKVTSVDDFLLDDSVPAQRKEKLFGLANGVQYSGQRDVLLYGQEGRYLWLWLELDGVGTAKLSDLRVYAPGDIFLDTFPQVYRNDSDFFHRYLSIFSSLYNDLDETIDSLATYIDLDTAPAAVLPVLAGWMGLELDGDLLTEKELRRLLRAAYPLLSVKGTRQAVEGIVKLFVEEPVYIVERNLLSGAQQESGGSLYGDTPFDFTILINRGSDEKLRSKLQMMVEQFKPLRSRANIVFMGDCGTLDGFSYLDVNGAVLQNSPASLDESSALTGMYYLQ